MSILIDADGAEADWLRGSHQNRRDASQIKFIQLSRNLSLSRKSQTLAEKSENRTEPIPCETLYSPFGNFMNIKKSRSNLNPRAVSNLY